MLFLTQTISYFISGILISKAILTLWVMAAITLPRLLLFSLFNKWIAGIYQYDVTSVGQRKCLKRHCSDNKYTPNILIYLRVITWSVSVLKHKYYHNYFNRLNCWRIWKVGGVLSSYRRKNYWETASKQIRHLLLSLKQLVSGHSKEPALW